MRRRVSAMMSSMRRSLAPYTLAAALLATFLAGCGGVSSAQLPPPTTTPYCQAHQQQRFPEATYSSESYDPHFWRPGIIVVGLVSADHKAITATDTDVANAVGQFLSVCLKNSDIGVQPRGIAGFKRGTVAAAFLQLTRQNLPDMNDADLKTVIDAINSSDQTLGVNTTIASPFIEADRVVIQTDLTEGGNKTNPNGGGNGTNSNGRGNGTNSNGRGNGTNSNGRGNKTNAVIIGVSPDWGMNGQKDSGGFGGGSPDGSPSLLSTLSSTRNPDTSSGGGKTIYVLDTVPPLNGLHSGEPTPASSYCQTNSACLSFLSGTSTMDVQNSPMPDEGAFICASFPCNPATANTSISKHGFYVSAIIHNLAPGATIHLERVLNDYGVGDFVTLINALSAIENNSLTPSDVIVNLSLSIEPPPICLIQIWENGYARFRASGSNPALNLNECGSTSTSVLTNVTGNSRYQDRLLFPLGVVISDMIASGYTIVAAAGNDSQGMTPPYGADMPAAFCGVHVAAAGMNLASGDWEYTAQTGELASFSNEPYVIGPNGRDPQCLYVPNDKNATSLTQIQATSPAAYRGAKGAPTARNLIAPGVGVCSLYLHVDDVGTGRDTNDSGVAATEWAATWSGSSFATAMVSGNLAANMNPTTWTFSEPCAAPNPPGS